MAAPATAAIYDALNANNAPYDISPPVANGVLLHVVGLIPIVNPGFTLPRNVAGSYQVIRQRTVGLNPPRVLTRATPHVCFVEVGVNLACGQVFQHANTLWRHLYWVHSGQAVAFQARGPINRNEQTMANSAMRRFVVSGEWRRFRFDQEPGNPPFSPLTRFAQECEMIAQHDEEFRESFGRHFQRAPSSATAPGRQAHRRTPSIVLDSSSPESSPRIRRRARPRPVLEDSDSDHDSDQPEPSRPRRRKVTARRTVVDSSSPELSQSPTLVASSPSLLYDNGSRNNPIPLSSTPAQSQSSLQPFQTPPNNRVGPVSAPTPGRLQSFASRIFGSPFRSFQQAVTWPSGAPAEQRPQTIEEEDEDEGETELGPGSRRPPTPRFFNDALGDEDQDDDGEAETEQRPHLDQSAMRASFHHGDNREQDETNPNPHPQSEQVELEVAPGLLEDVNNALVGIGSLEPHPVQSPPIPMTDSRVENTDQVATAGPALPETAGKRPRSEDDEEPDRQRESTGSSISRARRNRRGGSNAPAEPTRRSERIRTRR